MTRGGDSAARILFSLLSSGRRRDLWVTLLTMVLGAIAELATLGLALRLLTSLTHERGDLVQPGTRWISAVQPLAPATSAVLLIVAALAAAGLRLRLLWVSQRFVVDVSHEIASAIFSRMLRQPYAEYVNRNSSEVLASMEKVRDVAGGIVQPMMQGFTAAVLALAIGGFLFAISPVPTAVAGISIGITYVAISRVTRTRLKENGRLISASMTERTRLLQEGLGAIRDILIDGSQAVFEEGFRSADYRFRRALAVNSFVSQSPRFIIEAAGIIAIVLIALAPSSGPGGMISAIPTLGALALGAQRLLPLLQQVYTGWSQSSGNLQLMRDIQALLRAPIVNERTGDRAPLPFERSIKFRNVTFSYGRGGFGVERVNMEVRKGERIGVIGETGSGKSTVLDLLMGLLEPVEGEILIDDIPLDSELRPAWQANIAHVPQFIFLIDATIAENIAFGETAVDMEKVRACALAAQLHDFIETLPDGYDTRVGERGIRLSGGQRQRVGIARALYKEAELLILDEATSALDDKTEAAVVKSISGLRPDVTIIMVAHRRSTLAGCNRIMKVKDGIVHQAKDETSARERQA